jgi:hypothetical protein
MAQHFKVVLLRQDGPMLLAPGIETTISETTPTIEGAYTSVRCGVCSETLLLRGNSFEHARTNTYERSQGREKIYSTDLYSVCPDCETEHFAEVDYMEYPENSLQAHHLRLKSDCEYVDVSGIEALAKEATSIARTAEGNLRSEVSMLRRAIRSGYAPGPITDLESALNQVITFIDSSVTVLGSYSGASKGELREVQQELEKRGYDANISEDLPDDSRKKLRQNIATHIMLSKFCIMIDKEPSGHIREYDIAKDLDAVLARITPKDGGSTQMIKTNPDVNNIETFEYVSDPMERLSDAVEWAVTYVDEREEQNLEKWDWYLESDPTKSENSE